MGRGRALEFDVDFRGLGEIIERNIYFETAGVEVAVSLTNPYVETAPVPNGNYRARIVQGNKRATIQKGGTAWDGYNVYFVSNTSGVYADIAIQY